MLVSEFTSEQLNSTFKEVFRQTDRASAIVSCALLEELLERTLRAFLLDHESVRKDLFSGLAPLSTMSAKISIAYHLGLISRAAYNDLMLINKKYETILLIPLRQ